MAIITLVAGDTLPTRLTYTDATGAAINITGYSFTLHIGYPTPLVKAAAIADGPNGILEFDWAGADLVAGTFPAEIVATDASGKTKTNKLGSIVIAPRIV